MLFSLFLGLGNANRFISFICEGDDNQTAKTINYWADEVKMCRNSFPKSFRYLKLVLWIGVLPCDSRHQLTSSLHGSETQHKKWKTYILTDVFHRERYQGQKITESRPEINLWLPGITTVLHLCYTHREGRGEKKKTLQSRHMSNICLPATHKTRQMSHQGEWGDMRSREQENNQRGAVVVLPTGKICLQLDRFFHVLQQPTRSPPILLLCYISPLSSFVLRWLLQRWKFWECRAKTDHFKAAYLTLAKFFISRLISWGGELLKLLWDWGCSSYNSSPRPSRYLPPSAGFKTPELNTYAGTQFTRCPHVQRCTSGTTV